MRERNEEEKEIALFLEGKTIKTVEGTWFSGGITLIFTDGSHIEIDPYEEYGNAYIGYYIKKENS